MHFDFVTLKRLRIFVLPLFEFVDKREQFRLFQRNLHDLWRCRTARRNWNFRWKKKENRNVFMETKWFQTWRLLIRLFSERCGRAGPTGRHFAVEKSRVKNFTEKNFVQIDENRIRENDRTFRRKNAKWESWTKPECLSLNRRIDFEPSGICKAENWKRKRNFSFGQMFSFVLPNKFSIVRSPFDRRVRWSS